MKFFDMYLGSLFSMEETTVYGYVTNTNIKFIVVTEGTLTSREQDLRTVGACLRQSLRSKVV